jgi:hypothetical protein
MYVGLYYGPGAEQVLVRVSRIEFEENYTNGLGTDTMS